MSKEDEIRVEIFRADTSSSTPIPVSGSSVKAGFPSPAQDYITDSIDLNRDVIRNQESTFFARVSGDSMQDAGIFDGDLAIVDKSLEPRTGDYVVAYIDGGFTIKEFRMDESGQFGWLIPHNDSFKPLRVTAADDFMVWGVVTHVMHNLRRGSK